MQPAKRRYRARTERSPFTRRGIDEQPRVPSEIVDCIVGADPAEGGRGRSPHRQGFLLVDQPLA